MNQIQFEPQEELYIQFIKNDQKKDMSVQHYHDSYEFYFQVAGKRYLFYDNMYYTAQRGDLAVYKPLELHFGQSRDVNYYERYVLNFKLESLAPILSEIEINLLAEKLTSGMAHLNEEQIKIVLNLFENIVFFSEQKGFLAEKVLYSAVLQLIMYVISLYEKKHTITGNKVNKHILVVLEYIGKHYNESITVDDMANMTHFNKYYFCHTFRTVTGATFLEYLNNVRLIRVHNLLMETKSTLDEIARQTGFSSAANLTRVFKKRYGVSPREFRKK